MLTGRSPSIAPGSSTRQSAAELLKGLGCAEDAEPAPALNATLLAARLESRVGGFLTRACAGLSGATLAPDFASAGGDTGCFASTLSATAGAVAGSGFFGAAPAEIGGGSGFFGATLAKAGGGTRSGVFASTFASGGDGVGSGFFASTFAARGDGVGSGSFASTSGEAGAGAGSGISGSTFS